MTPEYKMAADKSEVLVPNEACSKSVAYLRSQVWCSNSGIAVGIVSLSSVEREINYFLFVGRHLVVWASVEVGG